MSKPRYKWWGYVKWCIRDYPSKCDELKQMKAQTVTPNYNPQPHSGNVNRTTENIALNEFTGQKKREFEAVLKALENCSEDTKKVIDAVHIKKTHTLSGAAQLCNISEITAIRYHGEFIRSVARNMGLLD